MDRIERLKNLIKTFPYKPGVYLMHDSEGKVIYVGKAKSLRKRVSSYFRHKDFASPRLHKLVSLIEDISTVRTETEAEALIVESRLIKKIMPFFNVDLKMNERYPYVNIQEEPFPKVKVTFRKGPGLNIGPFVSAGELRHTLRLVERYFPLRICDQDLSKPRKNQRPCIRHSMGKCLAPCAGLCSKSEYGDVLDDVILLLRGKTLDLTDRLRRRMDKAARSLDFEEAAKLRDTLRALWRFSRQRVSMTLSEDLDQDTWRIMKSLQETLSLPTVPWRIDGFDISHFSGHETYGVTVVFEQGLPNPSLYRRFAIKDVQGIDDFRSMAETVRRRYSQCLKGQSPLPQLILIDGGKEQLKFAKESLDGLGLAIPMVSLAEREEEIFTLDSRDSILLDRGNAALQLLQRVRDESHRYAIAAHRSKRDSRLKRSALEDIPGIGKRHSASLLAKFGSVQRIAQLDQETLTKAPGIGPKRAKLILEHLREEEAK